jgi:hypothetical protein
MAAIARRQRQTYAKCGLGMQQPERNLMTPDWPISLTNRLESARNDA